MDNQTNRNGIKHTTVHDESGQEFRVALKDMKVIKCRKLNSRVTVMPTGQPLNLGIRAYKEALKIDGKTRKQINKLARQYKAKIYEEVQKNHAPYVKQSATFEGLEFAEGVTVR